jgi:hypothetical protein
VRGDVQPKTLRNTGHEIDWCCDTVQSARKVHGANIQSSVTDLHAGPSGRLVGLRLRLAGERSWPVAFRCDQCFAD